MSCQILSQMDTTKFYIEIISDYQIFFFFLQRVICEAKVSGEPIFVNLSPLCCFEDSVKSEKRYPALVWKKMTDFCSPVPLVQVDHVSMNNQLRSQVLVNIYICCPAPEHKGMASGYHSGSGYIWRFIKSQTGTHGSKANLLIDYE